MAPFVQGKSTETNSGTLGLAFTSNVTAGNTIVVAVNANNTGGSMSDTLGNTWAGMESAWTAAPGGGSNIRIFYAYSASGGADTPKYTGSGSFTGMAIMEATGLPSSGLMDGSFGAGTSGTSTSAQGTAFTPATASDVAWGAIADDSSSTMTVNAGWLDGSDTTHHELNSSLGTEEVCLMYRVAPGGSVTAGGTLSSSSAWAVCWGATKVSGGVAALPWPGLVKSQAVNRASTY